MGFVELENAGKQIFERYPIIKRSCKRVYQLGMYAISNEKFKSEGNVVRVSPDDKYEYYFGYYDKSPWDITDRYMICLRVRQAYKSVAPKEDAQLLVVDNHNNNKVTEIAVTNSWNVQQGCMAQWLGPDFDTRIIYNDCRDGHYCAVIYNFKNKKEEKVLPCSIYDVSKDGTFGLSLDFSRLHRMRPGYGYSNLIEETNGVLCPNQTCIWKIDLQTGKVTDLLKYSDLAAFENIPEMAGAEHKVNHLMISPNGKRFMVLHRWLQKGHKFTRLVTANCDGTDLYNLSDDTFVSHCYWKNDDEILSFLRKKESGDHYYLMKDKTQEYKMFWPEINTDGHCSYSPDGKYIVTDTYPNRKRLSSVYLCTETGSPQGDYKRIARVFAPFRYDNNVRCDLHPRWNRAGDKICIDSVHEGRRGLYIIHVKAELLPTNTKVEVFPNGKYKVVYIITNCKKTGPMNQTLNIIKNLDRSKFEPILITLFKENLDDSIIASYRSVCLECYCLDMNKKSSLVVGKQKLSALLDKIKPDLIQGLGMPPYTMSLGYKKAAHFVTLRNYCYEDYPAKYGKALGPIIAKKDMALIDKQVKKGETFVTCSKSLSEIYNVNHGYDFGFIRNGVDISRYVHRTPESKIQSIKKLGLPDDKIIVIYTGQIIERKDQESAIEGILKSQNAPNTILLLLGNGANFEALKQKYKGYNNIIFTGNVSNVEDYLRASDFYLSTSKSEGMPNGVLEAMAIGLPLLLSDIPQHKEIFEVDDCIGILYQLGNVNDLVDKIDMMSISNLQMMGEKSYKVVSENFTDQIMSQKYQNLYLRLIKNKDLY